MQRSTKRLAAAIAGCIAATLNVTNLFGLSTVTTDQQAALGLLVVAFGGLVVAWRTRNTPAHD